MVKYHDVKNTRQIHKTGMMTRVRAKEWSRRGFVLTPKMAR